MKISSENVIFERATHRGPTFCGEIETSRLKFRARLKFRSRLKISSEMEFFRSLGPLGNLLLVFQGKAFKAPRIQKAPHVRELAYESLIPRFCRADLGRISYLGPANFRKIACKFLSEFYQRIFLALFSALFLQGFRRPQKMNAQNCRHSSPISHL